MEHGPAIIVTVSSSTVPVRFRAEDSPTWGMIIQQLGLEHGPGVLKDGQGFNKLLNAASMDQAVPLGTYQYITGSTTGTRAVTINIPEHLGKSMGTGKLDYAATTDFSAPKQATWTEDGTAAEPHGLTLKWEVVEGCCMRVNWPHPPNAKQYSAIA